ncbi:DUF427 domain-containing protein [Microvirga arsenatis]|uniref:DUF427 domain-containing protein n=1 Tax=Microvirga arsenatis TaxID=2692265 RepID=A0ABW9YSY4_9HYPH|nr:DUF427 domain-containing protein [Microvirga arsenatis]NBJ09689.1 DUF427 domain-containing protein [Microvirga arsenatis]NBJ23452.1 DUF427 domain-containing protein [Microvirga arsenatis]
MKEPGPDHPITITQNAHRIRVMLGGFIVAETTKALTLREATLPPVQYIPREDVRMDLLDSTDHRTHCPYKGDASYFTVNGGGLVRENAAWSYEEPHPPVAAIREHLAFYPDKVDAIEEFKD